MFNLNPHELIDRSAISLFEHEHIWLHVVAHVVLVIMPVGLLFLLMRWLYLSTKWLTHIQPIKHHAKDFSNLFELPVGLMGFMIKYSGKSQIVLAIFAKPGAG